MAVSLLLKSYHQIFQINHKSSEYSWNSDEHKFISMDESASASPILKQDDDEIEELESIGGFEHTDHIGWGCQIVGFHPHNNILLLHMSRVGLA
jgi:hypothetical protein